MAQPMAASYGVRQRRALRTRTRRAETVELARRRLLRGGGAARSSSAGRRGHLVMHVMHVMVVVVMMMVVMMVMHLCHRSAGGFRGARGGRGRFLRDGVAGEGDGESGGGDKALDHGQSVLSKKTPAVFALQSARSCLNST